MYMYITAARSNIIEPITIDKDKAMDHQGRHNNEHRFRNPYSIVVVNNSIYTISRETPTPRAANYSHNSTITRVILSCRRQPRNLKNHPKKRHHQILQSSKVVISRSRRNQHSYQVLKSYQVLTTCQVFQAY